MKLIFKYIKPFLLTVLISLTLLFGQAYCDLTLPNLMSEMVNVGIQAGGIDECIPDALSENGAAFLEKFMGEADRNDFRKVYEVIPAGEADPVPYPAAGGKEIFVRKDASAEDVAAAQAAFDKATYSFLLLAQDQMTQEQGVEVSEGFGDISSQQVETVFGAVSVIPEEMTLPYREKSEATDEAVRSQTGATFIKLMYTELGMDLGGIQRNYIIYVGAKMLLVALLGGLAAVLVSYCSSRVAAAAARQMRLDVFRKVSGFTNSEFDKFSTASLITRTTNDVQHVSMLITMGMRIMCYAPIMGIGGVIMAVNKSLSLSWIIAAAVLVLLGFILVIMAVVMPKFKSLQKLVDKLNLVSRENLSGLMVIRAFGNEKFEEERFDKANRELTDTTRFVNRSMAFMMPFMTILMNLVTLAIVWVGANAIAASTLQIGDMMAFMQYAMHIIMSFLMIAMMFIMVPRALVSANRIGEVLDCSVSIQDPEHPKTFPEKRGTVTFDDVSFKYPGAEEYALEHISFTAEPGKTTAFIGATGSGKSTLVNLIPRFYEVTEGSVQVNGIDVREVSQHQLRSQIGFVPQKGVLFSGDILSNVEYGCEDLSESDATEAIRIAQAADFVFAKEEGLHAHIAQGGTNVSGGQKQRLAIARALATKAPIYIFDDSFSALDFKTDAALRRELAATTADAAVLIVAQRVSTIMNADQILVLEDGKVVGKGTHRELLRSCPTYREIAESQLSKEELE